jgi:hypothetical protein
LYLLAQGIAQQNPIEQKALLEQLETNGKLSALYDGVNKINDPLKANTDAISGVDTSVDENTTEVKGAMDAAAKAINEGSLNGYLGNIVGDTDGLKTDVIEKFGDLSNDLDYTEKNTAEAENSLKELAGKQGVLGKIVSMPKEYFDKLNQMKPTSADQWVKQFESIDKNLANLTTQTTQQQATYYDTTNKTTGSTSFTPSTSPTGEFGSNGNKIVGSTLKKTGFTYDGNTNQVKTTSGNFSASIGAENREYGRALKNEGQSSGVYYNASTDKYYVYN